MIRRDAGKNDLRTRVVNYFQIYWRVRLRISGEEPAEIRGTALIQQSGRHMILQDFVPSFTTQRHNYRPGISIGFRQTASVGPAGAQNRRNRTNRRYRPASAQQTRTNNAPAAPAVGLHVGQHKVEIGCDRRRSRWRYNYQKIRAISFEIAQMKKMRVSSIRSGQFQATKTKMETNSIQ